MDVKEKLVELLLRIPTKEVLVIGKRGGRAFVTASFIADHLIANGVTVQEWISVEDRLPDLIPCKAGTAYSEAVNVLTTGRKVLTAIWDGDNFLMACDAVFWEAEGEEVTHWTPVLLPLPEPPKEGRQ